MNVPNSFYTPPCALAAVLLTQSVDSFIVLDTLCHSDSASEKCLMVMLACQVLMSMSVMLLGKVPLETVEFHGEKCLLWLPSSCFFTAL